MKTEAEVNLTPQQVAECFWNFDAEQQAAFFGHLGAISLSKPEDRHPSDPIPTKIQQ